MKRILAAVLVAGVVMTGFCAATVAADTAPVRGFISVSTSSSAEVAPDTVEISIAVKTSDHKSLQKAADENKLKSENVYTALKAMINAQNGDFIKTANYNARPVYIYSSNNKKSLDKYEVSNNVIVHTKNISKAGDMIDKAISLGATDVNSLNFSVSNYEKQCNDLLAQATKKAKTRVDIAAKESSTYVTGVKSMNISCSENTPRVAYRYNMANSKMALGASMDAAPEAAATPIQSGNIKVYANVNAEYFVK